MTDEPLKAADLGFKRKKRTPNGISDEAKHAAEAAEGMPQPGEPTDAPTALADGSPQAPTLKNEPTTTADQTSTGQSSGARKHTVASKAEVERRMRAAQARDNN